MVVHVVGVSRAELAPLALGIVNLSVNLPWLQVLTVLGFHPVEGPFHFVHG